MALGLSVFRQFYNLFASGLELRADMAGTGTNEVKMGGIAVEIFQKPQAQIQNPARFTFRVIRTLGPASG